MTASSSAIRDHYGAPAPTRAAALPAPTRARFEPRAPHPADRGDPVRLEDGRLLRLRPIRAGDAAALQRAFRRLSPEEVRMRFLHVLTTLSDSAAARLCDIDWEREAAFVLADDAPPERAEIRGVARIYVDAVTESAEFAVLVEHAWTGLGLGALLMTQLIRECRRRGLRELWGYVLVENHRMLELCEELGFARSLVPGDAATVKVALAL
ncbi:sortase [Mizugakiibacter sediminis]|uniref:Sortase n=2 Tax=Mizugakiibacter sediminis TaxID=1475481 RepID=A0A0K8QQL3_9GAMM|nr:GNAT family N-acetyltransferase [Mizugakiibacter sediminis]GAP66667.1 sortase [Mizugakiibacter sediminis]